MAISADAAMAVGTVRILLGSYNFLGSYSLAGMMQPTMPMMPTMQPMGCIVGIIDASHGPTAHAHASPTHASLFEALHMID